MAAKKDMVTFSSGTLVISHRIALATRRGRVLVGGVAGSSQKRNQSGGWNGRQASVSWVSRLSELQVTPSLALSLSSKAPGGW